MHRRQFIRLSSLAASGSLLSGCAVLARLGTVPLIERHLPADFSGVAAVRQDAHSTLVVQARGQALREENQPITRDTRFLVGSITKWITAVTVLRLADMGTLALDAPIARHLPELPAANGAVTLRQLMSNRSGIPNGLAEALKKDRAVEKLEIGPVEAALRFGAGAPVARPGEQWDYSYTNWILVAAVVERARREPFTETVEELVLAPAGVRDTSFAATGYEDEVGMAVAYSASGQRKIPAVPPMVAASGTLYSTAADLVKIADAVYRTPLLSEGARKALSSVVVAQEDYALGGKIHTLATKKGARSLAWEAGAIGGYKTLLAYDPADGRAVVLLNNTDMQQAEQAKIALALIDAM
ncbi:beta-lactamase family protein [Massilia oculi]|uniref:Beta-lactamase family protein n=1 Tax=Massilia hydrophila TaxID=3044279 RepID=A0ABS7YJ06_9BURK|nr:serine hydrolase domain-containing protein [Massilia oculi]MCA1858234.1 beta-lactamase family protein [Massilia oculi]